MSTEKNHINYSADDIRRYWQNQMSAAEMHALEKAAMEDPFLADAMEGYSKTTEDQESNLAILRGRIAERTGAGNVISIKRKNYVWRVAAAVVLIAGLGTLTVRYVTDSNKRSENAVAKSDIPLPPPSTSTEQIKSDSLKFLAPADTMKDLVASGSVASNSPDKKIVAAKQREILVNVPVADKDSTAFANAAAPQILSERVKEEVEKNNADKLEGRAAGIRTDDRTAMQSRSNALLFNNFSGRVVDPQNNGIPMANVRMNNANVALTDQNGNFQFKSFDSMANVSIVSSGYSARDVNLAGNQSSEPIVLQVENNKKSKLSEVVSSKKKTQPETKDLNVYVNNAQPVTGWKEFAEYLEKNKKISAKEGTVNNEVVVTFKVDRDGKLSSFNIEKSLTKEHDAEAIRLIKQGPAWMVTKGKKPRVKVIIKF
ncbi:MAG TPA: hypothetical protein VJT83_01360 [Chitinophagaceae bacterium]|nr:hypothetical protein [Chitinophagaceae bacterium]